MQHHFTWIHSIPKQMCSLSLAGRWGGWVCGVFLLVGGFWLSPSAMAETTLHAGIVQSHYTTAKGVVGINLEITPNSYPLIITVYPGTPAAQAGLQSGDRLVTVDRQDVYGLSREAVDSAIPDQPGQSVRFLVQRHHRILPISLTVGPLNHLPHPDIKRLYQQTFQP